MHNSSWLVAALIFGAVSSSCSEDTRSVPPAVVSEQMGLSAGQGRLRLGEDCSAFEGSTGCASGVCLRLTPGIPPHGVCSQRCGLQYTTTLDGGLVAGRTIGCPTIDGRAWTCTQVMQGSNGFLCTPPLLADGGVP